MNINKRRILLVPFLVLLFGLAAAILLGLASLMPVRAAGPICYVGPDFSDDYSTIGAAIADAGCTDIRVDAGVYSEHLTIGRPLTIRGSRTGSTIIDGGGTDRVLAVTSSGDVAIYTVYIYNGNHSLGGGIRNEGTLRLGSTIVRDNVASASQGGGIWNSGTLTIENNSNIYNNVAFHGGGIYSNLGEVTISDSSVISNAATSQSGGGVFLSNGPLVISDSDILSNTADEDGAGVASQGGVVTITGSLVMSNTAGSGDLDYGGGIYSFNGSLTVRDSAVTGNAAGRSGGIHASGSGALVIENSTISGNRATYAGTLGAYGGGLYNSCDPAMLTGVTINGNTSTKSGGGIHNVGAMTVTNITVSGNEAPYGGGINNTGSDVMIVRSSTIANNTNAGDVGPGGIQNYGTLVIQNSIVAYNDSPNCANSGTLTSNGYNMETSNTCGFGSTGDQVNTDPNLGPLEDNGGDTFTHALPEGSPAIEAGSCSYLSYDQRGKPRPADLPGVANVQDGCDIGAFEDALEAFLPLLLRDF